MTSLLAILALASQAVPNLKFDVHSPEHLVSGLPLVVSCTVRNDSDADIYANLGTNRAGWLAAEVLDQDGRVMAQSTPEVPLPITNREHTLSPGPLFEPRRSQDISVALRMDTSTLESGTYTVAYDLDLLVAGNRLDVLQGVGRKPNHMRARVEAPLKVERNPLMAEAEARRALQGILASPGANNGEAIRRLMLIDHRVSLPLVAEVTPTRWTDDQVSYFLRETAPYATLEDARWLERIVRPGVRSWAQGAIGLMKLSQLPGVAVVGSDIQHRLGTIQP